MDVPPPALLGTTHGRAPSTHRQVLRGESAQAGQVPPGGSVELLHLLSQLLLEPPLLFVLLSVRELHHNRRGAALWSDTAESEGVTAGPHPLARLSSGSSFLTNPGAHGRVWNGFLKWSDPPSSFLNNNNERKLQILSLGSLGIWWSGKPSVFLL